MPVIKRHAVYTATFCISLFIPVMKAEIDNKTGPSTTNSTIATHTALPSDEIETVNGEDISYYQHEADDISIIPHDEFQNQHETAQQAALEEVEYEEISFDQKIINDIIISGNRLISSEAILNYIPYKKGEPFDSRKTSLLIRNLYEKIKRFKNIHVSGELVENDKINLHVIVKEKPIIKEIIFKGNNGLQEKEIRKKIDFDVPALDQAELKRFIRKLQKLYRDKNYHHAQIDGHMELDEQDKSCLIFDIKEGKKTFVNQILFTGNSHISSKELRSVLYTHEEWILGFLDGSGSYQPERLEADRHMIEQHYQNHGFMKAKVIDVDAIIDDTSHKCTITYHIEEGDYYTISEITVDGQGILNADYLQEHLPIKKGDAYSREKIADSIKVLEMLWGDLGYIYAHIDPSIQPDDQTCTVKIAFGSDTGSKVFLNKITIVGNKKTRDRIIRRRLLLEEGCLITRLFMEESKNRVESLGYFDMQDGVNWKIRRIDNEHADLDLLLKEIKTGHANLKLGFGGSPTTLGNPGSSVSLGLEINDTNLFGSGLQFNFQSNISKDEQNIFFNLTEPWLFDKPILAALDFYHRRPSYDEFKNIEPVNEILTGGSLTIGFVTPLLYDTQVLSKFGIDSLNYEKRPISRIRDLRFPLANIEYQSLLDKLFKPADFVWWSFLLSQDKRNNPMHPSRGIRWTAATRFGLPSLGGNVGFHKFDFDFHWWTPLIGETDLTLHLHTYLGIISTFKNILSHIENYFI